MEDIKGKVAKTIDLSTFTDLTDLTAERLKKIFEDVQGSPEKLRSLVNHLFVSDFKPTFVEPRKYTFKDLQDVDFLGSPEVEGAPRPFRLIDIGTGNIVDVWNTSSMDSYCMLSHRWKGDEITLAHIKRAREKHLVRSKNGEKWKDELEKLTKNDLEGLLQRCCDLSGANLECFAECDDDMHLVFKQCIMDILEQEKVIVALKGPSNDEDVGTLLEWKTKANAARSVLNWAKQDLNAKKSQLERCRVEERMLNKIIERINKETFEKKEHIAEMRGEGSSIDSLERTEKVTDTNADNKDTSYSEIVKKSQELYKKAQKELEGAIAKHQESQEAREFFRNNSRLGDAVDEILCCLQRWKSSIKLLRSMQEAREIFRAKVFQKRDAYYIWSDTCCIDKSNYGELSQSLSLMGDWYESAEFCLVHLDTDSRESEAVGDWRHFKGESNDDLTGEKANITNFSAIKESGPEWAKRAWTLQELVMSKMTYFINSKWKSLSRPVESLGYVYPLIPFIKMYTSGSVSETRFGDDAALRTRISCAIKLLLEGTQNQDIECNEDENIGEALRLISMLHVLGFEFPANMMTETAMSELSQSVHIAVSNLVENGNDNVVERAKQILKVFHNTAEENPFDEEGAQEVINLLLARLVAETEPLVVSDRKYIAEFGNVNMLDTWKKGQERSGFPAKDVFELSGQRKATVPVDHIYSLMGIFGVRFQSFSAEGYPKALSRLLDEVIIARNDISVFNWNGVEMGSPIRGRSLYPSSHKAYKSSKDHGRKYNEHMARETQKKRDDILEVYHGIIDLLQRAIDCVKAKGNKDIPLTWVKGISVFIRNSTFDELRRNLESLGKILIYVNDHCFKPNPPPEEPLREEKTTNSPPDEEKSSFTVRTPLTGIRLGTINKPKIPKFGMGSFKPSLGKFSAESVEGTDGESRVLKEEARPVVPEDPEWKSFDDSVKEYLRSYGKNRGSKSPELPDKIRGVEFKRHEQQGKKAEVKDGDRSTPMEDLLCPNPIIVNNAGIEGIFDIQRIIVTMTDREKLRRQISRATSPKQKISGWCTLSTGFANVTVNFACEKHMLERELEVSEAIEDIVIKEEDREQKTDHAFNVRRRTGLTEENALAEEETAVAENGETEKKYQNKATPEEKTTARVIEFIQEPQLHLVAGEWVLARFSGVLGARWFLCCLDLGSTHQFYGRRIATTEIDFKHSTVESGLVNAWQAYMRRKKRKMCSLLDTYIESLEHASKREEYLGTMVKAGNYSFDRVKSLGTPSTTMSKLLFEDEREGNAEAEDDSGDERDARKGLIDDVLDQGKKAAMALGEYTVIAALEKVAQLKAEHLDKHLATSVLERTPKSLRSAVESVDENRGFLPAMFHSSMRVHVF